MQRSDTMDAARLAVFEMMLGVWFGVCGVLCCMCCYLPNTRSRFRAISKALIATAIRECRR